MRFLAVHDVVRNLAPLDGIGFAPAISDFCVRVRSLRGTPWQWPDASALAKTPNVRCSRRELDSALSATARRNLLLFAREPTPR